MRRLRGASCGSWYQKTFNESIKRGHITLWCDKKEQRVRLPVVSGTGNPKVHEGYG